MQQDIRHYLTGAFVGVELGSSNARREDAQAFRAVCRILLGTHTADEARTLFDQELQRAVHGEVR